MSLDLTLSWEGHRVRMAGTPERPLWVAKDVCRVLAIHNSRDALRDIVPDAEKGVARADTLGGPQEVATVTEAGLYRLISRSRKPAAARFQSWLFGEVLPSIRRHGCFPPPPERPALPSYDLDDPGSLRGLVEAFAIRRLADMEKIAELVPKAEAHDRLAAAKGDVCLQDAGRALGRQPNLLIAALIEDGLLFRGANGKPEPRHDLRERGYFAVRVLGVNGQAYVQTMVTPRGLLWLAGRYPASDTGAGQLSLLPGVSQRRGIA